MATAGLSEPAEAFLGFALSGDRISAVGLALELLNSGQSRDVIITDTLAPVQRQVGELWHQNRVSVATEHLVTGVSESALHALAGAAPTMPGASLVVVACAEGDWHAIAAHMLTQQLQARGLVVAFLGASTRRDHVARFLDRHRPEALVLSCSRPIFFAGVARLADAAHAAGLPVLAGGRALRNAPEQASRLGADGWGQTIDEAFAVLTRWRAHPLTVDPEPTVLDEAAVELDAEADVLATEAFLVLTQRRAILSTCTAGQLERIGEDLALMVRFAAAALLVDDQTVFMDFLDWLAPLLESRRIPDTAMIAMLESLEPLVGHHSPKTARFFTAGMEHLSAGR